MRWGCNFIKLVISTEVGIWGIAKEARRFEVLRWDTEAQLC